MNEFCVLIYYATNLYWSSSLFFFGKCFCVQTDKKLRGLLIFFFSIIIRNLRTPNTFETSRLLIDSRPSYFSV